MKEFKKFVKLYFKSFSFVYIFCSICLLFLVNILMDNWGILSTGRCVIVLLISFAQMFVVIAILKVDEVNRRIEFDNRMLRLQKVIENDCKKKAGVLKNEKNMEFNDQNKF